MKYLKDKGIQPTITNKRHICYCRVLSQKQKGDLLRQMEYMKKEYS